LELYTSIL